jgi:hypothetical protein
MKLVTRMISLVIVLLVACGGTQSPQVEKVEQIAYECATVDIGRTVPEISMTVFQNVMAVIQAGADGWKAELVNIGTKYGKSSLACAAKAAYDALTAHPPGARAAAPTEAALRARAFIDDNGFAYR